MSKLFFFLWLFSPWGLWSIGRDQKQPVDASNRFNKVILMWFVFTRYEDTIAISGFKISRFKLILLAANNEDYFVHASPWLKLDLWEMVNTNPPIKKELVESIPKSEIESLMQQSRQVALWLTTHDAYEHLYDELESLLTNHKEYPND
ncbi:MAG: hypothetical protein GY818_07025 [Planctomycetaceae bacterium]|nr:hypothetical protein [Planctomycetaceae bacterium]